MFEYNIYMGQQKYTHNNKEMNNNINIYHKTSMPKTNNKKLKKRKQKRKYKQKKPKVG